MNCVALFLFYKGVFNTTSSNICNQSPTNGREVITLRPNKQRTKKSKNPFGSCSLFWFDLDDWLSLWDQIDHIDRPKLLPSGEKPQRVSAVMIRCAVWSELSLYPLWTPHLLVMRAQYLLYVVIALSQSSSSSHKFSCGWFADYFAPYF